MYAEQPNVFDVDLPLLCSYLSYWWAMGPDAIKKADKVKEEDRDRVSRQA